MTQQLSRIWLLAGALSVCGFTLACESGGGGDDEDVEDRDGSRPGGSDAGTNPSLDTGTNPGLDLGLGDTNSDTSTPAEDGISCGDIIQCINGTDGSQAAAQGCISQGTPTGQSLIQDVFACLQTNCASAANDAEFASCQQEFCASDLQACSTDTSAGGGPVVPPGEGDLECNEIVQCINATDGSQAAAQGCIAQGTPTGQSLIQDVFGCLQANCASASSQEEFAACQQAECSDELAACTGQPIPSGDDTCREIITCSTNARSQAELDACLLNGTPASANQAVALYNCAAPGCQSAGTPAAAATCILESTSCAAEAAACQ